MPTPHPTRSQIYTLLVAPMNIDTAILLLRLLLGGLMIYHGYGKVFGNMEKFTLGVAEMGFPAPAFFAWSAALSEFLGGILLIVGLGTRINTLLVAATMMAALFIRHGDDPFKSKELALVYLGITIVLHWLGPGRLSLDNLLFNYRRESKRETE